MTRLNRTLADQRRRIALLIGILLSLTIVSPTLAGPSRVSSDPRGSRSAVIVLTAASGTDGVEWTYDSRDPNGGGGIDGVEWT